MSTSQILLIVLGLAASLVLLAVAFAGPSAAKHGSRRLQGVRLRHSDSAADKLEAQMRKALAARKPGTSRSTGTSSRMDALNLRLYQTGQDWTAQKYIYACAALALGLGGLIGIKSGSMPLGLLVGGAVGAGLPHMVVGYLIKRRVNQFVVRFPDAIELLVRGLRSGLPVTETLGIVSSEIPGPVGEEFKLVTERIRIGRTMEEALVETADRLNLPEFNFFCITLAIQRETGGNLAETLANLSDVLRKRSQMKLKIKAMSSESKASAYIVGALPFLVFLMVEWVSPDYLAGFFHDQRLELAGIGGLVWMGIGVFIMAKMVSFEI